MDHRAHGLRRDHPIFRRPLQVKFTWEEEAAAENYAGRKSPLHPAGVGEKLRLALFEKEKGYWNPILVDHAGFFADLPGFEGIAEGYSAKIIGSLSLARQGRWFYWGYSIDPARLTEGGRRTLVNTIRYMVGKRAARTVFFACKPRRILATYLELNRRKPRYRRSIEEHFPGSLTPRWRRTYTPTREGCAAWLEKYLPYVYSGKKEEHRGKRYRTVFEVDEEALALATPNRERSSLERWIELAGGPPGPDREKARVCLERYVHPAIAPKKGGWPAWYEEWRARIIFVESTGFWWQADPCLPAVK